MNWYCKKVGEDAHKVEYRYSRANKVLDGKIVFDKQEEEFIEIKLCAEDQSEKPGRERIFKMLVEEKFFLVVDDNYPQEQRVFVT